MHRTERGMIGNICAKVVDVQQVPKVGEFVRYVCAFCAEATDDDPHYVHLTVDWPGTGESQALGAHDACLRAAIHESIPLAAD